MTFIAEAMMNFFVLLALNFVCDKLSKTLKNHFEINGQNVNSMTVYKF